MTDSDDPLDNPEAEFAYDLDITGEEELIAVCLNEHRVRGKERPFVYFDVGANRGDWTNHLLVTADGMPTEGYLFDLDEAMIERLILRFGMVPSVTIVHNALSDTSGPVEYRRYPGKEGVNTMTVGACFWDYYLTSEIAESVSTTGDAYCLSRDIDWIDLLKIDTEGWEWFVLHGFFDMLTRHRIGVVQFEYGYVTADHHVVMKDFFRFFEDLGYSVGPLSKSGVEFRPFIYSDNDFNRHPNYVAMIPVEDHP
jgi:FkbM family methyltransferase